MNWPYTTYRKDARHVSTRDGLPGHGRWPLTASPPEQSLLYRMVAQHYPVFVEHLAAQDRPLPGYVQQESEAFLKCGRLEHGFLRVRCGRVTPRPSWPSAAPFPRIPVPAAFVNPFTSQAARVLPELWRTVHGGECALLTDENPAARTPADLYSPIDLYPPMKNGPSWRILLRKAINRHDHQAGAAPWRSTKPHASG